jgi:hypothetical protein
VIAAGAIVRNQREASGLRAILVAPGRRSCRAILGPIRALEVAISNDVATSLASYWPRGGASIKVRSKFGLAGAEGAAVSCGLGSEASWRRAREWPRTGSDAEASHLFAELVGLVL